METKMYLAYGQSGWNPGYHDHIIGDKRAVASYYVGRDGGWWMADAVVTREVYDLLYKLSLNSNEYCVHLAATTYEEAVIEAVNELFDLAQENMIVLDAHEELNRLQKDVDVKKSQAFSCPDHEERITYLKACLETLAKKEKGGE